MPTKSIILKLCMIFGEEVVLQIILMTGMDENLGNTERITGEHTLCFEGSYRSRIICTVTG